MPQAMVKPFVQFLNLGNVDNALLSDVWHFSEDGQHASFEQLHWCKLCLAADQGQDWCTNSPSLATKIRQHNKGQSPKERCQGKTKSNSVTLPDLYSY